MSEQKINDGGPAFPHVNVPRPELGKGISQRFTDGGMTLRDYFAAKAMQVYLPIIHASHASAGADEGMKAIADAAYGMADAMLVARGQ